MVTSAAIAGAARLRASRLAAAGTVSFFRTVIFASLFNTLG
jgi:hypothetical protein